MRPLQIGHTSFALAILLLTAAPELIKAQPHAAGFVIDASRPYVYIAFERVGKRKPLSDEESATGLWLRLRNNTHIPIEVMTFDAGTGDEEAGVLDEIVQLDASVGFLPSGERAESLTFERAGSPRGYSLDVGSASVIGAGDSLLFSVPLNHVGPSWYLRVRFAFRLSRTTSGRQPYSYVEFTWDDVPKNERAVWKKIGNRKQ